MKKYLHLTAVLFLIAALSGLILAVVNGFTSEPIRIVEEKKRNDGIAKIFPDLDPTKTKTVVISNNDSLQEYYEVQDKTGTTIGYVINIDAPKSYDEIVFLLGIDLNGKIVGTSYLNVKETPGLGLNVDPEKASNKQASNDFNNQFVGKTELTDADTISGATISSSSVVNGIKIALEYYNTEIKK